VERRSYHILAMTNPIKTPASAATERILSLTNHLKDSPNPADDVRKAKMSVPYKFQGWMGLDNESTKGKMVWQEFEPKTWTEDDVDIKVTHCGICGSDIHTLRSGWVCFCPKCESSSEIDFLRAQLSTHAALAMKSLV
jgi:hypothetical protein